MAKPRVFISSTYYDLRNVRSDLDRFIRGMGFDPVRHEVGQISYGQDSALEDYAYREIDLCEILICIIGGKYGTSSADGLRSITQRELRAAIDRGKQVYVFVEETVNHEYKYFLKNKSVPGVKWTAVDNIKVHEFLEEIHALPRGNPIFPFGVSSDITSILQEQWAGLFQRLLIEHAAQSQTSLVQELQRSLHTVGQLVEFLTDQKGKGDQAVQEILFANHPIFDAIRKVTNNRYRLYFANLTEFEQWLMNARMFERVDEFVEDHEDYFEWRRTVELKSKREVQVLYVKKSLFDEDGRLVPMTQSAWNENCVRFERQMRLNEQSVDVPDDDIPF